MNEQIEEPKNHDQLNRIVIPSSQMVEEKLDKLAELEARKNEDYLKFKEDMKAVEAEIPPEIVAKLEYLKLSYADLLESQSAEIEKLIMSIEADVILIKNTVDGHFLKAVYSPPRVTWDTQGLKGYSVAHPEILVFQKIGQPSVMIRKRK
jgi:hypothetical protein